MRLFILFLTCIIIFPGLLLSQEVIISGFPVGVGRSVDNDFFKPYHDDLQMIADTLKKYPLAEAIITGGADGQTYQIDNDTKNPALALGRAHTLRNYLTTEFNINHLQLVISSEELTMKGPKGRYASIHISQVSKELTQLANRFKALEEDASSGDVLARIEALEQRPPVEKHFTEINNTPQPFTEKFGLQVSGGFSSSPFGGIPIIGGAVTWERNLFLEVIAGHTFWTNSFTFESLSLDTKKRLISGQLIYYPFEKYRIAVIGGWVRIEEISNQYYEYVKLSEGPLLGLRFTLLKNISLTTAYNPSKQRLLSEENSISKNNQFLISLSFFEILGGGE